MVGINSPSGTEIKQDMLLYFFSWSKWSDTEFTQGTSYLQTGLSAFDHEAELGGCTSTEFWEGTAACYKPTVLWWSAIGAGYSSYLPQPNYFWLSAEKKNEREALSVLVHSQVLVLG